MTSNIGRALVALETGLAAAVQDGPMAWRFGRALGAMEVARDLLLGVDPADVAKWLGEECCAVCASTEVATLTDEMVPYCARHANELRQEQDTDAEDAR